MTWRYAHLTPAERTAFWLLVSSYAFGAVVLGHRLIPSFVYLSSFHLLFVAVLLLRAHRPRLSPRLTLWAAVAFLLGYWAEYIGVHYRWLFGEYLYGDVLGPKFAAIPIIIGVNWIIVAYSTCASVNEVWTGGNRWWKAGLSAVLLVLLDVLIEPVAIRLDYWTWSAGTPPLQNYLGWLAVGLLQTAIFYALVPYTRNRLALVVLALQVAFFAYLHFAPLT